MDEIFRRDPSLLDQYTFDGSGYEGSPGCFGSVYQLLSRLLSRPVYSIEQNSLASVEHAEDRVNKTKRELEECVQQTQEEINKLTLQLDEFIDDMKTENVEEEETHKEAMDELIGEIEYYKNLKKGLVKEIKQCSREKLADSIIKTLESNIDITSVTAEKMESERKHTYDVLEKMKKRSEVRDKRIESFNKMRSMAGDTQNVSDDMRKKYIQKRISDRRKKKEGSEPNLKGKQTLAKQRKEMNRQHQQQWKQKQEEELLHYDDLMDQMPPLIGTMTEQAPEALTDQKLIFT